MYCIFILFVNLIIIKVTSQSIQHIILDYFKTDSIREFRKEWENNRKTSENAIELTMKETVGYGGMNVYIRKVKEKIASGYYHNDNQVRLILKDLNMDVLPRCYMPDVQLSLSSNVLKIQTTLSKMIIHAEYVLLRNKSDIIYEMKDQDPYESSPFLFQQVRDDGEVAITIEGCLLSGYIIAILTGESINLGYQHFRLLNCQYTFEISMPGSGSPPVIAKYNPHRGNNGLSIAHLLMKPINDELVPKLQAAMFSFINTTSVLGEDLLKFRKNQEQVFLATSQYITESIRNLNKITIEKNRGVIEMADYVITWNDGRLNPKGNINKTIGQNLSLMGMVLTGLDTVYSAHIGGPYKMNTVLIGEEIRFSSLQVRGYLEIKSTMKNKYAFATEINDMSVDLQLDVNLENAQSKLASRLKNIEVTGYRTFTFTAPTLVFGPAEALIGGYLLNEIPKLIQVHLKATLPVALWQTKKNTPKEKEAISSASGHSSSETESTPGPGDTPTQETSSNTESGDRSLVNETEPVVFDSGDKYSVEKVVLP